jgi:hypothetical protein
MKEREQDIEHSCHRSQACLDVGREPVMEPFEVADNGDQRQSRLHHHAFIPGAFGAQFEVGRNALLTAKAEIAQDNGLPNVAFNDGMKRLVMGVERSPIPVHYVPLVVEQPAEFDTYGPASFVFALLPDLLGTPSLTNGKEQFYWITINDREESGSGQQSLTPVLMGLE